MVAPGSDLVPPEQGNVLGAVRRDGDVELSFPGAPAAAWRVYRDGSAPAIGRTALAPDVTDGRFRDRAALSRPATDYYLVRGLSACSRTPGP